MAERDLSREMSKLRFTIIGCTLYLGLLIDESSALILTAIVAFFYGIYAFLRAMIRADKRDREASKSQSCGSP